MTVPSKWFDVNLQIQIPTCDYDNATVQTIQHLMNEWRGRLFEGEIKELNSVTIKWIECFDVNV